MRVRREACLRAGRDAVTDAWRRAIARVHQPVYSRSMATKTERLNLRLTPSQDAVVRQAAAARGESTSDYVLRHAVEAAEADLADRRVFVVDDAAWDELQRLLSAPVGLPAAMAELLAAPSALEQPPG